MKHKFSKQFLYNNRGCYDMSQIDNLSFLIEEMTAFDVATSEIPLKDKYWFVCKKLATKEENQQIAVQVAEIVLPIFEKRYPDDYRPKEAIKAAKSYIAGHISLDKLIQNRKVADADAADADAAVAAYAVAAYAVAAADAADAAAIKEELYNYLVKITVENISSF